jgi:hypothetical protein
MPPESEWQARLKPFQLSQATGRSTLVGRHGEILQCGDRLSQPGAQWLRGKTLRGSGTWMSRGSNPQLVRCAASSSHQPWSPAERATF